MSRSNVRSGAAALVEALAKAGVDVVFGYPGGNVIDIFEAVRDAGLRFVLGGHEQGCVHEADGYARALGRPGVIVVTSGPGLTNTITGLGVANMDGIPLVLICGQVPLDQIGTDAFQEADTTGLTRAVSKHNFLVKRADEIPETVAQAFYIATHGKPGPVVIDIPRDCQQALTNAPYPARVSLRAYHPECFAKPTQVTRLAKWLNAAKRPLFYVGGGVIAAEASKDLVAIAHKANVPVATTMMGIGSIDEHDPLALGMAGMYGTSAANRALAEADLIVALGMRFNDRTTAALPRRHGTLVHVDCDPSAIDKNVRVDLGIVADVKDLLTTVNARILPKDVAPWCVQEPRVMPASHASRFVSPAAVVKSVYDATNGDVIVTTDVGQHQLWTARCFRHVYPRHFITSGGMGAMGFGIPAAIGAAIARPGHKVVALVGDGGALMTSEELVVAARLNLSVVFVVFVNGTLGLVRQMQQDLFCGHTFATDLRLPDFVLLAKAYGVKGMRVEREAELADVMRRALKMKRPVLVEVKIDPEARA